VVRFTYHSLLSLANYIRNPFYSSLDWSQVLSECSSEERIPALVRIRTPVLQSEVSRCTKVSRIITMFTLVFRSDASDVYPQNLCRIKVANHSVSTVKVL